MEALKGDNNAEISAYVANAETEAEELKGYEKAAKNYLQKREHYKYIKKTRNYEIGFKPFLTKAMERELSEESHIPAKNIIKTEICGYIRILERGGKPDFFGITFLSCTKEEAEDLFIRKKTEVVYEEIKKNRDIMDFDEVYCQHYVPVAELFNKKTINELSQKNPASLQLHCLENIILRNKQLLIDNGIKID